MQLRTNMIITKKSDATMKKQIERADIHCHILPGVDDGAQTLEEAGCLLKLEKENHISMIFLTCHYRGEVIEKFIQDRQNAYDNLMRYFATEKGKISLKLGAEVFFKPGLSKQECRKLCLGDTDYLLLELPVYHRPYMLEEEIFCLKKMGIVPVIAHIERYPYLFDRLEIIYEWAQRGTVIQANVDSFMGKQGKLLLKLVRWNMVHVIATDCHSSERRPPKMEEALRLIERKLGKKYTDCLCENAKSIFRNEDIDTQPLHVPRKVLGTWL